MLNRLLLAFVLAFGVGAAQAQRAPQEPYTQISPAIPSDTPGKIEVVEFFWYGCPHCYDLEPSLDSWTKKLPKDVEFRRVPVPFNERWAIASRVYYALEGMGEIPRLHKPLFDAIHKDGLKLNNGSAFNQADFDKWLTSQKADPVKFAAAYKSFTVESKVKRALGLTQASKIDGVPAIMVNGRYVVSASSVPSHAAMLRTADQLIEQSRAEMAPAKK